MFTPRLGRFSVGLILLVSLFSGTARASTVTVQWQTPAAISGPLTADSILYPDGYYPTYAPEPYSRRSLRRYERWTRRWEKRERKVDRRYWKAQRKYDKRVYRADRKYDRALYGY
jgi:hypothetical protein